MNNLPTLLTPDIWLEPSKYQSVYIRVGLREKGKRILCYLWQGCKEEKKNNYMIADTEH